MATVRAPKKIDWEEEKRKCKRSFKYFLLKYARTFDVDFYKPNVKKKYLVPVKKFPRLKAFKTLAGILQRERFIAIAKSRQIMATWLVCSYLVWKCNFYEGLWCVVKSTNMDKSGWGMSTTGEATLMGDLQALLSRCYFVYTNLPEELKVEVITSKRPALIKFCHKRDGIEVPSIIRACSSNPEELRQFTINILFIDEAGFQKDARIAYASTIPGLAQNGQVILVSTPNGKEFFYNIVYDIEGF